MFYRIKKLNFCSKNWKTPRNTLFNFIYK